MAEELSETLKKMKNLKIPKGCVIKPAENGEPELVCQTLMAKKEVSPEFYKNLKDYIDDVDFTDLKDYLYELETTPDNEVNVNDIIYKMRRLDDALNRAYNFAEKKIKESQ